MPTTLKRPLRDRRWEVRVTSEEDDLLDLACCLSGTQKTQRLRSLALEWAREEVASSRSTIVGVEAFEEFVSHLDDPLPEETQAFLESYPPLELT